MEIRIGIQHSPRELVIESDQDAAEVLGAIGAAVENGTAVTLQDAKGRTVLVSGPKVAYAEVSTEEPRRVGFLG